MTILAFNGSPRENGSTAALLNSALEGAASKGADTDLIHLNRLTMKGCQGCFACKLRDGKSFGRCILKDDMTPLYSKMEKAHGVILGAPIYFGTISAQAKLFIDRLFAYFSYNDPASPSLFPKKISSGIIITQGAGDAGFYSKHISVNEYIFKVLFGASESLVSVDAPHVADYAKIAADAYLKVSKDGGESIVEKKMKHRREVFPGDCEMAFKMGERFAAGLKTNFF